MISFASWLLMFAVSVGPGVADANIVWNVADRTLLLPPTTASAWVPVDLVARDSPLRDDCDKIQMILHSTGTLSGPGSVDIILDNRTPWWKELQLFINGSLVDSVRARDFGGTTLRMPVFPNELGSAVVGFIKPKFLGTPTRVYQFVELSTLANRTVTFRWWQECG